MRQHAVVCGRRRHIHAERDSVLATHERERLQGRQSVDAGRNGHLSTARLRHHDNDDDVDDDSDDDDNADDDSRIYDDRHYN